MTSTTATRPVNLTTHEVHRAQLLHRSTTAPRTPPVEAAIRRPNSPGTLPTTPSARPLIEVAAGGRPQRASNLTT